jgi:broad specificity phosphatase PhoE
MILDCIRHGLTASNAAMRFSDSDEEPLQPDQFALLGRTRIDAGRYARIWVSPARRCVETATALGLGEWTIEPRLMERRLGVFQGLTPDECRSRHPGPFADFSRFNGDFAIPSGESRGQHLARVLDWLGEACAEDVGPILAVTHGGVIDFLYRLGADHPTHGGDHIHAGGNGALSRFEVAWPKVRLVSFSEPLP